MTDMTVEDVAHIRRMAAARRLDRAVQNISQDMESAYLACEAIGGEDRHPHTFEALEDLQRALRRLSREAAFSVQAVLDGTEDETPEEAEMDREMIRQAHDGLTDAERDGEEEPEPKPLTLIVRLPELPYDSDMADAVAGWLIEAINKMSFQAEVCVDDEEEDD